MVSKDPNPKTEKSSIFAQLQIAADNVPHARDIEAGKLTFGDLISASVTLKLP